MKTIILSLIAIVTLPDALFSQEMQFPGYGSPSRAEIDMQQCSFDKNANAVILLHEAFSNYDDEYKLITWHHIRIKILNEKGIDAANIEIPYYRKDDFEHIYQVSGLTLNPGPGAELTRSKLDKRSIFDQSTSKLQGDIKFAFPSVKPGSIIEYTYQSIMKHYGGLREWVFQDELPVVLSSYKLTIVPNAEFAYVLQKRTDLPIDIKPDNSGGIYFEMQHIPGLGSEPYMDARRDYIQKVIFQLSGINNSDFGKKEYRSSWNEVIKELNSDSEFGEQLNKNIPGTPELIKQVENLSAENKMKAVYDYVRGNMSWNSYHSIYCFDGLKTIWQKKQGTNGDINLLLINLLKQTGLEVYPLLVSERSHGKVNKEYPFLDQFNTVVAYVIINNKKYFLDATDKFISTGLIPYKILNTTALLVNKKMGGIIQISDESMQYNDDVKTKLTVADNGSVSGKAIIKSDGYARYERLADYKEDKEAFLETYFQKKSGKLEIKDFEIKAEEHDSIPLEQHCSFTLNASTDGNYNYIPTALFSGFNENPFLAEERFSNINFGYKRIFSVVTTIEYSKTYTVDALPKSLKLRTPDGDIIISRQMEQDKENALVFCTVIIEFKNSLYQADAYPLLKEMYKKLFAILNEPVVLKKK